MRIILADVADRRRLGRPPRVARAARLEALGLTVATLVVCLGVCLAAWGSLQFPGAPAGAQTRPEPLPLGAASSPADLEPYLSPRVSKRARASLYRSRLQARTMTAGDLQSPQEQALIGQRGVFATAPIAPGIP